MDVAVGDGAIAGNGAGGAPARSATSDDPRGSERSRGAGRRLAKGLGWFSIGVGAPQVLAPGLVNRAIGIDDSGRNRAIMRAVGLRELGGGAGILSRPRPAGFLFARVAGDAMDLLLLGAALRARGNARNRVAAATAAVAGVALLDVLASARTSRSADPTTGRGAIRARAAITIDRPRDEVYRSWRTLENLPGFMHHLESVRVAPDGASHWVAKAPAGRTVEWDAEVTEDVPNERIAWRSTGGDVPNAGSVSFGEAPGGRGTEVRVDLEFTPPGRALGAAIARIFGEDPVQQLRDDLRRFKQVMEVGEVVRSDGSPEGTRTHRQLLQREAQPLP